jgi:hypothetical protein
MSDHARFAAWTRPLAAPSRRHVLRGLGGLVGTRLGLGTLRERAGANPGHICCSIRSEDDGTVLAGCFKQYGDECAPIPEGYELICKQPVLSCGDCSKTLCPNTKKGRDETTGS